MISSPYHANWQNAFAAIQQHIHQVEIAALKLFDALRKANHLTKKDRLLLQIAAILHNCGSFLNLNDIGENSYKIVTSTEIIGLSHQERMIVAYVDPIYNRRLSGIQRD